MSNQVDLATQRLIERLVLEDIRDNVHRNDREGSRQVHEDDDIDSEEGEDLEEALRLSRAFYEGETFQRVTRRNDGPPAETSRAGAARERNARRTSPARRSRRNASADPQTGAGLPPAALPPPDTSEEPSEGECVICTDTLNTDELVRPAGCPETEPCHYYCEYCLKMAFEGALRDEALFPVRCCPAAGPLDISQVREHFDDEFQERLRHRKAEMRSRDRIYCHRPTCSVFIDPEDVDGDKATCQRCLHDTCARCKKAYHPGADCPEEDDDVKETIELGKEERWQRCPSCRDMVDLHSGCNHMMCRCGAEFCFLCGTRWKTCDCPIVGEEHLPPEEQDRRDRLAAERVHEDEVAQWEAGRQFDGVGPPWPLDLRPDFDRPDIRHRRNEMLFIDRPERRHRRDDLPIREQPEIRRGRVNFPGFDLPGIRRFLDDTPIEDQEEIRRSRLTFPGFDQPERGHRHDETPIRAQPEFHHGRNHFPINARPIMRHEREDFHGRPPRGEHRGVHAMPDTHEREHDFGMHGLAHHRNVWPAEGPDRDRLDEDARWEEERVQRMRELAAEEHRMRRGRPRDAVHRQPDQRDERGERRRRR